MSDRRTYGRLEGRPKRRRNEAVFRAHGYLCATPGCLFAAAEVDHVKPLHKGGREAPDNLQALCRSCHRAKTKRERSATVPAEWLELLNEVSEFTQNPTP